MRACRARNLADSRMYYGSFDVNIALLEKATNNLK